MQGIYKITNIVNDNCYIGQSKNIHKRWREHRHGPKSVRKDYPLYRAFAKYGLGNFKFEILEEVNDPEVLLCWELYYYHTLNHVYNQTEPSESNGVVSKSIYQIDKDTLEIIGEFDSVLEASKITGVSRGGIYRAASKDSKYHASKNYYWCYVGEYYDWTEPEYLFVDNLTKNRVVKPVLQLDKNNKIVAEFSSITNAEKATNIKNISRVCQNKRTSAGGYTWKYKE